MYRGNKFKNSVGAHLLQALFFEMCVDVSRPDTLYTLKTEDHDADNKTYVSIHRAYVDMEDTSEYNFALKYFDNWAHWKKLIECSWFKPHLEAMREELDTKLKARSLEKLKEIAADPLNKNHYMANKLIYENGLHLKKDNRGRPSKVKITEEANKLLQTSEEVNEDYERIFGTTAIN